MECKLSYHSQYCTGFRELIDTLWNVNKSASGLISPYLELIDTLWNVNAWARIFIPSAASGINRYIMECKLIWLHDNVAS